MKSVILKIVLAAGFLLSFQTENLIPYKDSRKLTWDDFQGPPVASSPFQAKTESNTHLDISTQGMEATIVMVTSFDKKTSWVKTKRADLLQHEQTHFDIAELWSRKFKQKLKGKTYSLKTFQKELNTMHTNIQKEGKTMQKEYDAETEHSVNAKAQEKWTKKINADLKSLSEFIPEKVTCKLVK